MALNSENEALIRINDRISSTSNDNLEDLLGKLLPKLLPLSNKEELRNTVLQIFSNILKRVKPLKLQLPCGDILELVNPQNIPFCCNFSLAFLDVGLPNITDPVKKLDCGTKILMSLASFLNTAPVNVPTLNNSQVNTLLMYLINFTNELHESSQQILSKYQNEVNPCNINSIVSVVGDWFIDIFLLTNPLQKGSVGSIQQGLSENRINRITSKKEIWTLPELKSYKLSIMTSFHQNQFWLQYPMILILSLIGICDNDNIELNRECSYKLNGARSHIQTMKLDVELILLPVIQFCLYKPKSDLNLNINYNLSIPTESPPMAGTTTTATASLSPSDEAVKGGGVFVFSADRSCLRDDVRIQTMHWLSKEMSPFLPSILLPCMTLVTDVLQPVLGKSGPESSSSRQTSLMIPSSSRLFTSLLSFALAVEKAMGAQSRPLQSKSVGVAVGVTTASDDDEAVIEFSTALFSAIDFALRPLAQRDVGIDRDEAETSMAMREACYELLERLSCRTPSVATSAQSLLVTLFNLLANEHEKLRSKLLAGLGALRLAFEQRDMGSALVESQAIETLIVEARTSKDPYIRQAALQWACGLFRGQAISVDTVLMLADDPSQHVQETVQKEILKIMGTIMRTVSGLRRHGHSGGQIIDLIRVSKEEEERSESTDAVTSLRLFEHICGLLSMNQEARSYKGEGQGRTLNSQAKILAMRCVSCIIEKLFEVAFEYSVSSPPFDSHEIWLDIMWDTTKLRSLDNGDDVYSPNIKEFLRIIPHVEDVLQGIRMVLESERLTRSVNDKSQSTTSSSSSSDKILFYGIRICYYSMVIHPITEKEPLEDTIPILMSWINLVKFEMKDEQTTLKLLSRIISLLSTRKGWMSNEIPSPRAVLSNGSEYSQFFRVLNLKLDDGLRVIREQSSSHVTFTSSQLSSIAAIQIFGVLKEMELFFSSKDHDSRVSTVSNEYQTTTWNQLLRGFDIIFLKSEDRDSSENHFLINPMMEVLTEILSRGCIPSSDAHRIISIVFKFVKNLTTNSDSFVIAGMKMYSFGFRHIIADNAAAAEELWKEFVDFFLKSGVNLPSGPMQFSACESLTRMCIWKNKGNIHDAMNFMLGLISELSTSATSVSIQSDSSSFQGRVRKDVNERMQLAVSLLIIVTKRLLVEKIELVKEEQFLRNNKTIALDICRMFLSLMKGSTVFIQDLASCGLCWCHWVAVQMDQSCAESVAGEVLAVLMRERKITALPPGIGVAGETTSVTGNGSPATGPGGDGSVAGEGGGPRNVSEEERRIRDALMAAATELGIRPDPAEDAPATNGQNPPQNTGNESDKGYGIYSQLCSIAKRTRDPAVLFSLLAQMACRDPVISLPMARDDWDANRVTKQPHFFEAYTPPKTEISESRLKELIPSLYMAKYDPSTKTREIMKDLWESLLPEEKRSTYVDTVEKEIIIFLTKALQSRSWKEREAAASALSVFLTQRTWSFIQPYFENLWGNGLRAMDDIRESTRVAASNCIKTLQEHVLRICDDSIDISSLQDLIEYPEERKIMRTNILDYIIPYLLDKGLIAPSVEIRGFSMGLLIKLIKTVKASLGEVHTPRVIGALVESMSGLEPSALAYMQFHTQRMNISDDELERMRLNLSKSSPMQEALDQSLSYVASASMPATIRILCEALKRGVGLATLVSAARSLSALCEKYPDVIGHGRPHQDSGRFAFNCCLSLVLQPRPGVSESVIFAVGDTLATLAKIVPVDDACSGCKALIEKYRSMWMESQHLPSLTYDTLTSIRYGFKQLLGRASHQILEEDIWNSILLISLVGSCEVNDDKEMTSIQSIRNISNQNDNNHSSSEEKGEMKSEWEKIWNDALIGSGRGTATAAIRKILDSILKESLYLLQSRLWKLRKQGVQLIRMVLKYVPGSEVGPSLGSVVFTCFNLLKGHLWKGRESVMELIGEIVGQYDKCIDAKLDQNVILLLRVESEEPLTDAIRLSDFIKTLKPMDDDVEKESDHMETPEDEGSAGTSPPPSPHVEEKISLNSNWSISLRGLLRFLLNETKSFEMTGKSSQVSSNGPMQYRRLSAAVALSSLPWESISKSCQEIFLEYLDEILNRARGLIDREPDLPEVETMTSAATSVESDNPSRINPQQEKKSTSQSTIEQAKPIVVVDLFGNRYGKSFKARPPMKRLRPNTNTIVQNTNDNVGDSSTGETTNREDEKKEEVDLFEINYTDPALRAKLLECLSRGWPRFDEPVEPNDTLKGYFNILLKWLRLALSPSSSEVWSVKRGLLLTLGAAGRYALTCEEAVKTMNILSLAISDSKFTQVRASSMKCLELLLHGRLRWILNNEKDVGDLRESVQKLVRSGSRDSHPSVVEVAIRVTRIIFELEGKNC